jgi:hypothetical protein
VAMSSIKRHPMLIGGELTSGAAERRELKQCGVGNFLLQACMAPPDFGEILTAPQLFESKCPGCLKEAV